MPTERDGGNCLRVSVSIFSIYYWASALAHIFLGLWMFLDPKRNYILDLVHFSENDPLLKASCYVAVCTGCAQLLVGFLGLCGAVNRNKFLLYMFSIFVILTFLCDVAIGTLSLVYKNKINPVRENLREIVKTKYGVSLEVEEHRRVTEFIDKLQFYERCCGSLGPTDFIGSRWSEFVNVETFEDAENALFPVSCCTQIVGASALNPLAKSFARCQQIGASRQWRHAVHQCCGGESPLDYKDSFWYITNTIRGTRSYVPPSCCKQSQSGRAWGPIPIDPMCTTYRYESTAFQNAVNVEGCHDKLQSWFNEQIWIFVGFGFASALTMMIGICLSCCLISKIRTYFYIKEDY
ncbi:unnamed protein product [Caenorhabditis bovis]|uniref:Tetraspanin n=1 Tax=Caenorhabditis bovis TaxID=2654633 RepID=A0A8S1E6B6_9PELO|nr:unnamed protein product [Caenorhabditis bovis]